MLTYHDQLNRAIELPGLPKRIVSLVPSQTELLYYLGLDEEVIGITKFCARPEEWLRKKTRVGGTKTVKTGVVASLQPDLIIANKEENTKEQIVELEKIAPVWISDVSNVEDALQMIQSIGGIVGKAKKAEALMHTIKKDFAELRSLAEQGPKIRTAYLIWKDPYMTVGSDTFIHDILKLCGLHNVFGGMDRYPAATIKELREKNAELVLLSSEPYPFTQNNIEELTKELPGTKILLVDGEIFSWYGSRMGQVLSYAKELLKQMRI